MSRALEMKNLVSDIRNSTKDRLQFVKGNKADTRELLTNLRTRIDDIIDDTNQLLARFDKEMKETAVELKSFLAKSEEDRTADFSKMMKDIQTETKDIIQESRQLLAQFGKENKEMAKDVRELLLQFDKEMTEMTENLKDLLAKSEETRKADFNMTMKDVKDRIKDVKKDTRQLVEQIIKDIHSIQGDVKNLLNEYKVERKETAANWGALKRDKKEIISEISEEEVIKKAGEEKAK